MPIFTGCPACWATLSIPDHLVGKKVRCAKCSQVFRVPPGKIDPAAPLSEGVDRQSAVKVCPACRGQVVMDATTCYHCGRALREGSTEQG